MKKLVLIFLLILIPYSVQAYQFCKNWTKYDTAFEVTYVGLTVIDWGQTRNMTAPMKGWPGLSKTLFHRNIFRQPVNSSSPRSFCRQWSEMATHT